MCDLAHSATPARAALWSTLLTSSGHLDLRVHLHLLEDIQERVGALGAGARDRGHADAGGGRVAATVEPGQRGRHLSKRLGRAGAKSRLCLGDISTGSRRSARRGYLSFG